MEKLDKNKQRNEVQYGQKDDDVRMTKMIRKTSHEIISAGKGTNLAISAKKIKLKPNASEPNKELTKKINKRLRHSVSKSSQMNITGKETRKSTDDLRKSESSVAANIPNSEKGSITKNIQDLNRGYNVGDSRINSLKTLETYIETMGIDVPSTKHLLSYNRVGKVSSNYDRLVGLMDSSSICYKNR